MLDIIIKDSLVADGTGGPLLRWDVGLQGGRIAWVGRGTAPAARRTLNAKNLILAPGFIDVHTHADISLLHTPSAAHTLKQGITTQVLGNCGLSVAPLAAGRAREIQDYMAFLFGCTGQEKWPWATLGDYLDHLQSVQPAVNALTLVAHGVVRLAVMGFDSSRPGPTQVAAMQGLLAEAMEQGAFGLSTGLQYAPGCYASIEEVIELARVVSCYGGIYATHMRNQSTALLDSIRDSIRVGWEAEVPVEISTSSRSARSTGTSTTLRSV